MATCLPVFCLVLMLGSLAARAQPDNGFPGRFFSAGLGAGMYFSTLEGDLYDGYHKNQPFHKPCSASGFGFSKAGCVK